jgi:CheY-like chemotaxis protein
MNHGTRSAPSILIASDDATDAALVKSLLSGAFRDVFTSTEADQAVEDFESRLPQVLVLAFNELAKAERYCLSLYRLSSKIHTLAHRTVILCHKDELKQVSELCLKHSFDDYVLFWPLNHDAPRLRVSVHQALRELAALEDAGPSVAEFAAQARRLSELEALLDRQLALGERRVDVATHAIERAERDIGTALHGFSQRLSQGALPDVVEVRDAAGLDREMVRLKHDDIQPPFRVLAQSMQPVKRWVNELKRECAPHLESARTMGAMAEQVRPTVLVVDDDEFQHKMVARILETENCRLVFVASGAEALKILGTVQPDLILMDVQMPGMDGIETTRRLKAVPRLAKVPVVMITGQSAGTVVVDSLKAGAADFVVKPFEREKLISKVARWSRPTG